jgi:arabinofuranosyltransferase
MTAAGTGLLNSSPADTDRIESSDPAAPASQKSQSGIGERLLFLYLPFATVIALIFPTTGDDPFITLRYAANLVHGFGPVYNPGQHVEGFTSPLHLLVAVVVYISPGGHALFKLKLMSLLFGILALREGSVLLAGLRVPIWIRRVGLVAIGSSFTLAFASVNALETSLLIWLLVALVCRLVMFGPANYGLMPTVLAFSLVLARFDSLLPMAVMALVGLWIHRELPWWRRSSWMAGAVAGAVLSMIGQYLYYGFPFPNTYYAKAQGLGSGFHQGLTYLMNTIIPTLGSSGTKGLLALFLIATEIALVTLGVVAILKQDRRCLYLVALVFGQVLLILKAGGDWMVGGRFVAPAVIPLVAIEILGLAEGVNLLRTRARAPAVRGVQVVASAGLVGASFLPFTGLVVPVWQITAGIDDQSVLIGGHFFADANQIWAGLPSALHCVRSGQLIATTEAGYLGFARQDIRIVDMRGLTDQNIAHADTSSVPAFKDSQGVTDLLWPFPKSVVGRELLKEHPSVIVTTDWPPWGPPTIGQPVLDGHYRFLGYAAPGGASMPVFGTPSVNAACFNDAGHLQRAIQRDLTAKNFDGLMVTLVNGRYQVRYMEFERPDRALVRTSTFGRPTEIDISGKRFVTSPGKGNAYVESPISVGSPSLAELPKSALGLFSEGSPSRVGATSYVIHTTAKIPQFLQDVAGSGTASMTITGTVFGYLVSESLTIVEPGRQVNATLYFFNFNRAPTIVAPG